MESMQGQFNSNNPFYELLMRRSRDAHRVNNRLSMTLSIIGTISLCCFIIYIAWHTMTDGYVYNLWEMILLITAASGFFIIAAIPIIMLFFDCLIFAPLLIHNMQDRETLGHIFVTPVSSREIINGFMKYLVSNWAKKLIPVWGYLIIIAAVLLFVDLFIEEDAMLSPD